MMLAAPRSTSCHAPADASAVALDIAPAAEMPNRLIRVLDIRSVTGAGGGADKIVLRTAARGASHGILSTVCAIHSAGDKQFDMTARGKQLGVGVIAIPQRWPLDPHVRRRLAAIVKSGKFDIIHSHDYKANFYALRLAKQFGALIVSTAHGWAPTLLRERYLYYPLDKRALRRFDAVIGVSTLIARELMKRGVRPERLRTILNGVDAKEYASCMASRISHRAELLLKPDDIALVSVGRLEREKRFDLLIEAFTRIAKQRDQVQLFIVGAGSLEQRLQRQISDNKLGSRCRLLGHRSDMKRLYQAFDVYVQSSETEGTPTVLLEAMAVGLPVIATDVGGTTELVEPGVDGLVVPSCDVEALSKSILNAIDSPQTSAVRAKKARNRVETQLSFDRRLTELHDLYTQILHR